MYLPLSSIYLLIHQLSVIENSDSNIPWPNSGLKLLLPQNIFTNKCEMFTEKGDFIFIPFPNLGAVVM